MPPLRQPQAPAQYDYLPDDFVGRLFRMLRPDSVPSRIPAARVPSPNADPMMENLGGRLNPREDRYAQFKSEQRVPDATLREMTRNTFEKLRESKLPIAVLTETIKGHPKANLPVLQELVRREGRFPDGTPNPQGVRDALEGYLSILLNSGETAGAKEEM